MRTILLTNTIEIDKSIYPKFPSLELVRVGTITIVPDGILFFNTFPFICINRIRIIISISECL